MYLIKVELYTVLISVVSKMLNCACMHTHSHHCDAVEAYQEQSFLLIKTKPCIVDQGASVEFLCTLHRKAGRVDGITLTVKQDLLVSFMQTSLGTFSFTCPAESS